MKCPECKGKRAYCFFEYNRRQGQMRLPSVDARIYKLNERKQDYIMRRSSL